MPALAEAFAATVMVLVTVAPFAGELSETAGVLD